MPWAESLEDCTKAVIDKVILDDSAKEVNYFWANGKSMPRITAVWEQIVLNVTSPKNMTKKMDVVMDVLFD